MYNKPIEAINQQDKDMQTIKLVKQDGNRSVGVFLNNSGTYTAMTYAESKTLKTEKGALNWLSKRGY